MVGMPALIRVGKNDFRLLAFERLKNSEREFFQAERKSLVRKPQVADCARLHASQGQGGMCLGNSG
jgi:hypothetical protein